LTFLNFLKNERFILKIYFKNVILLFDFVINGIFFKNLTKKRI